MRFIPAEIDGAWIVELDPLRDERGTFARTFCAREFAAHGLAVDFPQHSRSLTRAKGAVRGMHFQTAPHQESKLVSCLRGAIFDVCVDLRPHSPTYRRWQAVELSPANGRQFYIPQGCAHGFQTLSEDAEVNYLISEYYAPAASTGVRHDDPAFAIRWPLPLAQISEKDRAWPDFVGADERS